MEKIILTVQNSYKLVLFLILLLFIVSCEPKYPQYPTSYTAEQLKYHPKDANGGFEGYVPLYSRTGINSVEYVKKSDLEKYKKKLQEYEDYRKQKVLKNEYQEKKEFNYDDLYGWIGGIVLVGVVFIAIFENRGDKQ